MGSRLVALALVVGVGTVVSGASAPEPQDDAATVTHVLNRLAYGPRPGDVARVQRMGVRAWIAGQLHPERLPDPAVDVRLAGFETLRLSSATIVRDYERPVIEERRERQRQAGATTPAGDPATPDDPTPGPPREPTPAQRKSRQVMAELGDAKLLRAVYSERQLEAVLTDFWFNHFNVFAGKGPTRAYVTEYERDVIRPHVFGRFRDLLGATARSAAMLFYLDNWENVDPDGAARVASRLSARGGPPRGRGRLARPSRPAGAPPDGNARPPRGLNENYARELMELHTLGVDGGYSQADVVAVARAFTGWTMRPREGSGFTFVAAMHDAKAKTVLGHPIRAGGGVDDGEQVLDLLAAHPSTARFIATKLVRRFVSDAPPQALVDRAAARFRETGGDLREVVRVIVTSPEFFAPDVRGNKLKTPFELVASALRASAAEVVNPRPLERTLRELGMPSYFCQPPTGYDDTAVAWNSPGALVTRMNLAVSLGHDTLPGARLPRDGVPRDELAATLAAPAFQHR